MILGRENEKLIILHNEVVINYNASIVCADAFCGSCVFSSERCPINYNIWIDVICGTNISKILAV